MSRQIDMDNPDSWDEDDRRYLQDRDLIPADQDNVLVSGVQPGSAGLPPNTGDVNTLPKYDSNADLKFKGKFDDYREMTQQELRDELRSRGLAASGTKGELVFRLMEDDEKPAVEDDEPIDEETVE